MARPLTCYLTPLELQSADVELISNLERRSKRNLALLRFVELGILAFIIASWLGCGWFFGKPAIQSFLALGPTYTPSAFFQDVALISIEAFATGCALIFLDHRLWRQNDKLIARRKELATHIRQMSKALNLRKEEIAAREEAKAIAAVSQGPRAKSKARRI